MKIGDDIEDLVSGLKEYINIQYELATLKFTKVASSVSAKVLAISILAIIFFLFFIFISIVAGFWFSTLMGSREKGFLIVAGIYLFIGLIGLIFRHKLLVEPIRNNLIKHILNNDN